MDDEPWPIGGGIQTGQKASPTTHIIIITEVPLFMFLLALTASAPAAPKLLELKLPSGPVVTNASAMACEVKVADCPGHMRTEATSAQADATGIFGNSLMGSLPRLPLWIRQSSHPIKCIITRNRIGKKGRIARGNIRDHRSPD